MERIVRLLDVCHDEHGRGIVPTGRRVRLLFVEDDRALAEMYRVKLELDGHTVSVASDGREALEWALREPPDLMFLDVSLPGMDGLAVLEALRRDDRTRCLPVVMLTNQGDPQCVRRAEELGIMLYRVKSETPPGMLSRLVSQRFG
jgi:CheY-like chemotaxis protein